MAPQHETQNGQVQDKIPVLDIGDLYNVTEFDRNDPKIQELAEKFRNALHNYGFAYLVNHGVPQDIVSDVFQVSKKFFESPSSLKLKYAKRMDVLKNFHGYVRPGQEALNDEWAYEVKELFDSMQQDRFYPDDEMPEFKVSLDKFENAGRRLMQNLLKLLALALKMDDVNYFCNLSKNLVDSTVPSLTAIRTAFYPSIQGREFDPDVPTIRCSEHSDWSILTCLWQDDIGGLEIKRPEGNWISADPIPNAIILNIGELLELMTRKYFPATPHRVIIPETEFQKKTARQSLGFFVFPDDDLEVAPLDNEFIPKYVPVEDQPDPYPPTSGYGMFLRKASAAYGIKTY